jgi:hypothetical protein
LEARNLALGVLAGPAKIDLALSDRLALHLMVAYALERSVELRERAGGIDQQVALTPRERVPPRPRAPMKLTPPSFQAA